MNLEAVIEHFAVSRQNLFLQNCSDVLTPSRRVSFLSCLRPTFFPFLADIPSPLTPSPILCRLPWRFCNVRTMFKNVFGSGFLVRTAHVVLTWIITLILFLYDTELRKQEETGQLLQPVLFVLLVLLSVLLYFAVSLMDPGFILSEEKDLQVSQEYR
ncbi:hypothetical protein XENORESO_019142 [Xenotaenia resolanae]|uniref:Uncharacterized protein n=1 Tax=Xenotaenia resolanae TaxID=208358 RepID=A0ABV0X938_9TELE